MKHRIIFSLFVLATATISTLVFTGCIKKNTLSATLLSEPKLKAGTDYLTVKTQKGYQSLADIADRTMTNGSIELGRVLFYDTRLSINDRVACASCHKQELGFADNLNFSKGFGDKLTTRNSSAIANPSSKSGLFWDIRAKNAYELSLMPVFNHIEMGMESDEMMIKKIASADFYKPLFLKAFGTQTPTRELISKAIAHFVNALHSENSKFDEGKDKDFSNFSAIEKLGFDIFTSSRANCSRCHDGKTFSEPTPPYYEEPEFLNTANIGLDEKYTDNGFNNGQFRIPTLRNIALTAPYMHDGRFKTLEEVIDHYSKGIKNHPNLDQAFKSAAGPVKLNFSETEKMALVAFLKTLTDKTLISDKRYNNPFLP